VSVRQPPLLDDRILAELMDRLRALAASNLPAWKPPPEGDPGTMLHRVFARYMELALERLNRVPEKNLLAFLELMGITLLPPSPARVPLTFALTEGIPPTLVPKGTQVATKPTEEIPALTFETEDDLTVLPARLVQAFTMDPFWDRYSDHAAIVGSGSGPGFTPFVGTARVPHVLHLGHEVGLAFNNATVDLVLTTRGVDADRVDKFLSSLDWRCTSSGVDHTLVPFKWEDTRLQEPAGRGTDRLVVKDASGIAPGDKLELSDADNSEHHMVFAVSGDVIVLIGEVFGGFASGATVKLQNLPVLRLPDVPFVERTVVRGPGPHPPVESGIDGRWLRAALPHSINDDPVARALKVGSTRLVVSAGALLPDLGFINSAPLDVLGEFRPFGDKPNTEDAFLFASEEVFGKLGASVTFDVRFYVPGKDFEQRWRVATRELGRQPLALEFLGENGWTELVTSGAKVTPSITVGPARLVFTFSCPSIPRREVNGEANRWMRLRLLTNLFGGEAEYAPVAPNDPSQGYQLVSGTGEFFPPVVVSFGMSYRATVFPAAVRQTGFTFQDMARLTGSGIRPVRRQEPIGTVGPERPPSAAGERDLVTRGGRGDDFVRPYVSLRDTGLAPRDDPDPALYLGFDAAFPEEPVSLYVAAAPRSATGRLDRRRGGGPAPGLGITSLTWEYFDGFRWRPLRVFDGTEHLTESGTVEFLTPADIAPLTRFDLEPRYLVRVRSASNDPFDTQRLVGIFLNAVPGVQAVTVSGEVLGSSDGSPGQTMRLAQPPVLLGASVDVREPEVPPDEERLAMEAEEGPDAVREVVEAGRREAIVRWHEVPNFVGSQAKSRHYVLDHAAGIVRFPDGRRGMVPPPGEANVVATYRSGGGSSGNVPASAIIQIAAPVAGLASVSNPVPADGGADVESVVMVLDRGPETLRHRDRAVATRDMESLSRQAAGTRVARARSLPNVNREFRCEPGWVTVLVVPRSEEPRPFPGSELIRGVEEHLQQRASAGLTEVAPDKLNIVGPGYLRVVVSARVVPRDIDLAQRAKRRVVEALDSFFQPLSGGPSGTGWQFGRDVYASEVSKVIEDVAEVGHIEDLALVPSSVQQRLTLRTRPVTSVELPEDSRVVSQLPLDPLHPELGTIDGPKAALLAEPLPMGTSVGRVSTKGFKDGDRITMTIDLLVREHDVEAKTVAVDRAPGGSSKEDLILSFPQGSRLITADGSRRTRMTGREVAADGRVTLMVEHRAFLKEPTELQRGDVLTLMFPFPMTITAVSMLPDEYEVEIEVEPYPVETVFPFEAPMSTLDNRIRLPLAESLAAGQEIRRVRTGTLEPGDDIAIQHIDGTHRAEAEVEDLRAVTDVVYLDQNFLVHPGTHRIAIVAGDGFEAEG
jgi:hypothetical protein